MQLGETPKNPLTGAIDFRIITRNRVIVSSSEVSSEPKPANRRTRRAVWHREDIKAELRKRYGTLRALSTSWGMNGQAITHTLLRPNHHRPTARRIAQALDLSPHELWPSIFEPETSPGSDGRNPNRPRQGRKLQKAGQIIA